MIYMRQDDGSDKTKEEKKTTEEPVAPTKQFSKYDESTNSKVFS